MDSHSKLDDKHKPFKLTAEPSSTELAAASSTKLDARTEPSSTPAAPSSTELDGSSWSQLTLPGVSL